MLLFAASGLLLPGLRGYGRLAYLLTAASLSFIAIAAFPKHGWRPAGWLSWGIRNFILIYFVLGALLAAWLSMDPASRDAHTPLDYFSYVGFYTLPAAVGLIGGYLIVLVLALEAWSGRPRLVAVALALLGASVVVGLFVVSGSRFPLMDAVPLYVPFLVAGLLVRVAFLRSGATTEAPS
jgi:hypothetical protein